MKKIEGEEKGWCQTHIKDERGKRLKAGDDIFKHL